MPLLITATAQMRCDKGAAPATLAVTSQDWVRADGELVATEADCQPMQNIPPFGVCSVTQKSCMPATQPWQDTRRLDSINGQKKLTKDSYCPCAVGGRITFQTAGHQDIVGAD